MASTETKEKAMEIFHRRKARLEHHEGTFDKAGRWYPSDDEEQDCCRSIRRPSRAWPYSLMTHCRTLQHVINLVESQEEAIHG